MWAEVFVFEDDRLAVGDAKAVVDFGLEECFALLQVKNGQLTRVFPTTAGELNCGSQNLQNVPKGA